jgi:hypothetical protein
LQSYTDNKSRVETKEYSFIHGAGAKLSFVACPTLLYFSTFSHQMAQFLKKSTEHKMCVLISSTNVA